MSLFDEPLPDHFIVKGTYEVHNGYQSCLVSLRDPGRIVEVSVSEIERLGLRPCNDCAIAKEEVKIVRATHHVLRKYLEVPGILSAQLLIQELNRLGIVLTIDKEHQ